MPASNAETVRAAHQAFNSRDFDSILSLLAEDFVYQDRAQNLTFRGREEFRQYLQGWTSIFSDAMVDAPAYTEAGNIVIAEFTGRGRNDGAFGPLPPTGKSAEFAICEIFRFNPDGKMTSGTIYYDQLGIMTQLGHVQLPNKSMSA